MAEKILPNLFHIRIPLPGNPLGWINSYVVKGPDRNLIIDTGFNQRECLEAMQAGLSEIEVDLKKTDFYITHMHADHIALTPRLVEDSSIVYINRPDKEFLENWTSWDPFTDFARLNGFPEREIQIAVHNHPGEKYGLELVPALRAVEEGETLRVGDYRFIAVATPGHTKGHTCLYEPERKLLISGDHILFDITPNITCWWADRYSPLDDYLASLDKVYDLQIDLVLPGHRGILGDCRSRIEELKQHHRRRMGEILTILRQGPRNAYETASMMSWDIVAKSWDGFPVAQKWFATGEAIAHLRCLELSGQVHTEEKNGFIIYST